MAIDRRQFLIGTGAVLAAPPAGAASVPARPVYLACAKAGTAYRAALFTDDGDTCWTADLPQRGHGGAFRLGEPEAVVFARRPGTFAAVVSRVDGEVRHLLASPPGRHFHGHGVFSADGRLLFTTENDFAAGRGVIGVWEAAAGYRRAGEFASHGIEPHDIVVLPDGATLAVANGGILTHPETGRRKLNIPEMDPSLALIDSRDGRLVASHRLPRSLHQLSIRHLAAGSGTVAVAMQYEGPAEDRVPLVALWRAGRLTTLAAPEEVRARMRQYCGAVAVDRSGRIAAVTSPRGNVTTFWDLATASYLGSAGIEDGCGVAGAAADARFVVSNGLGQLVESGPGVAAAAPATVHGVMWDNHIVVSR